jgi:wyosine [tRNA(Phe)-imidazoG37] synthetase (radical SAM superfamily)
MDMERFLVAQHRLAGADLIPEYRLPADSDRLPPALLPAVTSRGCPFSCLFCAGLSAYRHRAATAGEVRTHIERYENLAGRRRAVLFFLDDVMNLDIERFKEIESHLEASPLGWTPVNGLRADRLDAEAIEGFASSGGFNLKISAESGDDRVLEEIIGKRMKAAASIRAAKLAQQGRVSLLAHYVVGFPGETTAEMNRTLKLAASLHQDHGVEPRVQFATPVPGSRLAHLASSRGLLPVEIAREQLGNLFVSGPCFDTAELPAGAQRAAVAMFRHRIAQHGCPSLLLDPGFACNQRCTYCCVAHLRRRRLPPSTLHRAAVEARSRAVRRVDIGGGEPTLLDDLAGLISHLRGLGFDDVGLVTNGRRLCYPSYTKSLIRAGLDRFVISVSGHTEALSREITRVEGGLDQTLSGLEHLEALAPPNPPALNITVCRSNRHALADMVRFYTERFRLGAINLQVVLPLGSAVESPEVFCSYEEVAEQVGEAVRAAGEHVEAVPVRVHNLPFCFLPEALPALLPEAYKGGRLQLDSTGKLGDFSDVVGEALGHAEWCGSCPAVISCPGMQATLIDRYRNQRWRAERMAETIESTDVEGILFGGVS